MPTYNDELFRLREEAQAARARFLLMTRNIRDHDVLRHAKDIWDEAQAALESAKGRETTS
jgi:hypothetical protein